MEQRAEFESYLEYLCEVLGHADRNAGLMDYCRGLMLPIERKSVEPLAAHTDPLHVRSKHQSLHHFVADSEWSDQAVLGRVRDWVIPTLGTEDGCYWIVDDSGHPKYGKHSVGVAHQYCGNLGKTANCQVAVSLSLATERGSVPLDYRLYLPKEWAADTERRTKLDVPAEITFATKPEIAVTQIQTALAAGVPPGVVLADAAYGDETAFRESITALGLPYVVGIRPATTVWAPGIEPLPPKPWSGRGAQPKRLRRGPGHEPVAVKTLAMGLAPDQYQTVTWRDGTNAALASRFTCLRVRPAHQSHLATTMRPEEWLLIEWPQGDDEPAGYWLATAPADATLEQLIFVAKMRWRIERDYRELKQEFGLSHYEGRNWRGFHHHATLCIAAYGFLTAHRLTHEDPKKNGAQPKTFALPADYVPRGRPTSAASCARLDHDSSLRPRAGHRQQTASMSLLRCVRQA
jgi:SRSO17 transposase